MDTPSIDEDCRRRFEAAWLRGAPLPIDECLPPRGESAWLPTLEELVAIELEFGWKADPKSGPKLEAYFDRYPALRQAPIARQLIQQEFAVRQQLGDRPTWDSYQNRFTEWAAEWDLSTVVPGVARDQGPRTPSESVTVVSPGRQRDSEPAVGHVLLETLDSPTDSRGRYTLARLHAEGGLGRVWIARDPVLNRDVALKELKPSPARHPEAWQRFLKEAQVTGQLEHPNIVPVYEFGRHADGHKPFYTMRFVRGQTLRQVVAEFHRRRGEGSDEPLERLRLLHALVSICNAISFAHSRGVVHRDLKPENVILGGFGEVLVLDWGLARTTAESKPGAQGIQLTDSVEVQATLTGHILGTPAYMSPEQAEGRIDLIDHRTDVYGLGAILFEILTGRAPHVGDDSATMLKRIIQEPTPRARDVAPSVPPALDAICAHAMEKNPTHRYPSSADLAHDVERYLADEPVSVYREPRSIRAARFVRRHRTMVSVATAAMLFLTIGAVVGLFLWQAARDKRRADLLSLQSGIESSESLILKEVKQGHFSIAANILSHLNDRAAAESSLPLDMRQRIAAESDRAMRIADFYRLSDLGERNEFLEYDDLGEDQCESALRRLGVFDAPRWSEHLPNDDLAPQQREQLREDAFREILLLASLRAKRGLMNFGHPEAADRYRQALELVEMSRQLRPTQSAQTLEAFCRLGLGQLFNLRPQAPIEPSCPADCYFIGTLHLWVGVVHDDAIVSALKMVQPLTGLDFTDSLAKSQTLLRQAVAGEPSQYWNYFMIGWARLAAQDFTGAELVFDTCVTLRGDNALGYSYRGLSILRQAAEAKEAARRAELQRRGLDDLARAREIEPLNPEPTWLDAQALAFVSRPDDALAAYQRAVDLEPPLETWNGRRVQVDKKRYLQGMLALATTTTKQHSQNPEAWSSLASAAWMLGQAEQAKKAVTSTLQLRANDPRALAVRGDLARQHKQFESALADFAAASAVAPKLWISAAGTASVHAAQKMPARALDDCDHLLEIAETDWQRVVAHLGRARALRSIGRPKEADTALAAAHEIDPHATE
jgi:eukaryotic-like serine/threonine-protein kinase